MDSTVDSGHNASATARQTQSPDRPQAMLRARTEPERPTTDCACNTASKLPMHDQNNDCSATVSPHGGGAGAAKGLRGEHNTTARRVPIPTPQSKIPAQGLHPTCVGVIAAKIGNVRSSSAACLVCGGPQVARSPSQPSARQRHGEWTARGTQRPPQDVSVDPLQKQSFQFTARPK